MFYLVLVYIVVHIRHMCAKLDFILACLECISLIFTLCRYIFFKQTGNDDKKQLETMCTYNLWATYKIHIKYTTSNKIYLYGIPFISVYLCILILYLVHFVVQHLNIYIYDNIMHFIETYDAY